jgi:hypothetical protein
MVHGILCVQAGIRCAAVMDWSRACSYLKGSLEAMILLFGKMDVRTISVAKLLHSARKGLAEGITAAPNTGANAAAGEVGEEGEDEEAGATTTTTTAAAGAAAGAGDNANIFGAASMISTPRTIEVASAAAVAPTYKDAIDLISPIVKRDQHGKVIS